MNQYLLFFVRIWLTLISKWQTCATKIVPFHFSGSFNFFHTYCIVGFLVIICWNRQSNSAVQCCLKRCKTFLGFAISHSLFHLSSVSLSVIIFVCLSTWILFQAHSCSSNITDSFLYSAPLAAIPSVRHAELLLSQYLPIKKEQQTKTEDFPQEIDTQSHGKRGAWLCSLLKLLETPKESWWVSVLFPGVLCRMNNNKRVEVVRLPTTQSRCRGQNTFKSFIFATHFCVH